MILEKISGLLTLGPADGAGFPNDSIGRAWNPQKWRAVNGRPKLDRLGRFIPIKSGRPPKSGGTNPAAGNVPSVGNPAGPDFVGHSPFGAGNVGVVGAGPVDFSDVEKAAGAGAAPAGGPLESGPASAPRLPQDEYTEAAAATVAGLSTVAILSLGAHVAPSSDQTHAMVRAYADCYRAYGFAPNSPPWLGPVIATGVWLGPHLADQRSQEKLHGWRAKLAGFRAWLTGRRGVKAATAAGVAAHAAANGAGE